LQAPKGRSNRVAKLLDHIMLKRPDRDFIVLKEALIELGQVHVVKYLELSPIDSTDRAEDADLTCASKTDFSQDYVRGWKRLLVNNRTEIVDQLTVNDELISLLIKFGVINVTFSEMLKVRRNFRYEVLKSYNLTFVQQHFCCKRMFWWMLKMQDWNMQAGKCRTKCQGGK